MSFPLVVLCSLLTFISVGQSVVGRKWTVAGGVSTIAGFSHSYNYNLRYISPRFRWSEDDEGIEENTPPEKLKNSRLMLEVIYSPPFEVFVLGFNYQSRFIHYKRLTFELYGGPKFFIVPGPDFAKIRFLTMSNSSWMINVGGILQFDLGFILPFIDMGGDGILTVGTEVNFYHVFKKPKKRYRLKTKPYNTE